MYRPPWLRSGEGDYIQACYVGVGRGEKGAKVKEEGVKWTARSLRQKRNKGRTNEGLMGSIYSKMPSNIDVF